MLKILLYIFSFIAILSVLLPFIKKDFWAFRVFDYPRLQKFTIIGILASCWFVFFRESEFWLDISISIFLSLAFFYLLYLILPFTFLGNTMIDRVSGKDKEKINLLVANIYQYNNKYQKLFDLVK